MLKKIMLAGCGLAAINLLMGTAGAQSNSLRPLQSFSSATSQPQTERQAELHQLFNRLARNHRFGDATYQKTALPTSDGLVPTTQVNAGLEGYLDGTRPKVGVRGLVLTSVPDRKGASHTFYLMNGDVTKAASSNLVLTENLAGIEMESAGNRSTNPTLRLLANEENTIKQLVIRSNHLEGVRNGFEGSHYDGLLAGFSALRATEAPGAIPVLAAVLRTELQSSPHEGAVIRVPVRLTAILTVNPDTSEPRWVVHLWADSKEFTFPTTFICR